MFLSTVVTKRGARLALLAVAVAIVAAGCGDDAVSPTRATLPAFQQSAGPGTVGAGVLSTETVAAMNAAIQDEYHAEFVYLNVIEVFGEVQPFYNILFAEIRHSEAIAQLFSNHGLTVPASQWNLSNVPTFASLTEACAAAVSAELENIALYDELLGEDLPQDVRNVFTSLRAASLENHLPAFQSCCACTR
jgi:hypothetical protein